MVNEKRRTEIREIICKMIKRVDMEEEIGP